MSGRLIIVANRLPVTVAESEEGLRYQRSPGGMAAALNPVLRRPDSLWVGYTGVGRRLSSDELTALDLPRQLVPVNVGRELYRQYYYHVANGSLWPVLHGFRPRQMYGPDDWQATIAVVTKFAEVVMATARPDDMIWVHDFQLIMLPKILREMGCRNRLGFFLHIPFAGREWFETLPDHELMRESLGMTDVCGFQTAADVERFRDYVQGTGFRSWLGVFPVGIGYEAYATAHAKPEVAEKVQELESVLAGKRVVFSISRLDYTKGIVEQLEAVELFLATVPVSERKKVVYKLVVAPSREDLVEYSDLKRAIAKAVAGINARLGTADWQPVDYDYRNYGFEEVTAWYCRADIMLVTPLIDGMNLIAKEYVATRPDNDGVLVLSRGAGAAQQMKQAVLVDGTNAGSVAVGLRTAYDMSAAERRRRHRVLRQGVATMDAAAWAEHLVWSLAAVRD